MNKENNLINKTKTFLIKDIWNPTILKRQKRLRIFYTGIRIFFIAVKGFLEDKVVIRASAMTYYSLLSIVPILAMAFGIAKGFGFDETLKLELAKKLEGHQDVLNYVVDFASNMLQKAQGGLVAGVGLVVLIWSVMKVLISVEVAFNDIWQVKKHRSWGRKLSDFTSIMLIAPIIVFLASGINVFIISNMNELLASIPKFIRPLVTYSAYMLPYILMWAVFTFMYIVIPNTKVTFKSALFAGVIAGTIFQILQWAYVNFQVLVSSYSAIYGTFAALPLLMIWMQTSWLIVLLGAELSFASQNVDNYEHETASLEISPKNKKALAILILHFIIKRFENATPAAKISEISHHFEIPVRLVSNIIFILQSSGLIVEVVAANDQNDSAFQPALYINKISLEYVISRIDSRGVDEFYTQKSPELTKILEHLDLLNKKIMNAEENILLKDL